MKCPSCSSSNLETEWNEYSAIDMYACLECGYTGFLSEFQYQTKLPLEGLEEALMYLEDVYNTLTTGDMYDQHGICFIVARIIKYLRNIKKLYFECAGCGRTVAPDEGYIKDKYDDYYCLKCGESGF